MTVVTSATYFPDFFKIFFPLGIQMLSLLIHGTTVPIKNGIGLNSHTPV